MSNRKQVPWEIIGNSETQRWTSCWSEVVTYQHFFIVQTKSSLYFLFVMSEV